MLRFALPLVVLAALVLLFIKALDPERDLNELPSPFIGKAAPEFSLPVLGDTSRTLSNADLSGQYTLVNVWATWCVGCRQEHDFLLTLAQRNRLPIYGINWRDDYQDANAWLAQLGDPYVASGFDNTGRAGIDWGVYGAPETFLVNEQGMVVHKHLGPLNQAIWEADFEPYLTGEVIP